MTGKPYKDELERSAKALPSGKSGGDRLALHLLGIGHVGLTLRDRWVVFHRLWRLIERLVLHTDDPKAEPLFLQFEAISCLEVIGGPTIQDWMSLEQESSNNLVSHKALPKEVLKQRLQMRYRRRAAGQRG